MPQATSHSAEQLMKPPYQRDENNESQRYPGQKTSRRGRKQSLIPVLIFGIVAIFMLSEQFPWVGDKVKGIFSPTKQSAIESCREAALQESPQPEFARIIKGGEASKTQNGLLIENVVVGEMSHDTGEQRFRITCHVDHNGVIANFYREEAYSASPAQTGNIPYQENSSE